MPIARSAPLSSSQLAPFSCQEREWSLSAYDGVVWSPAGHHKRAMFACRECEYEGDRFNHTKKHHMRIHVLNGTAIAKKRKYQKGVPVATMQEQKRQKRALQALQTRAAFAAPKRVLVHTPLPQEQPCANGHKQTEDTQKQKPNHQQILHFGQFGIKWAEQSSFDNNLHCRLASASDAICDAPRASTSDAICDAPDPVNNSGNVCFLARLMELDGEECNCDTMYGNLPMFDMDGSTRESSVCTQLEL